MLCRLDHRKSDGSCEYLFEFEGLKYFFLEKCMYDSDRMELIDISFLTLF